MNARCFVLPAILLVAFVSGCAAPSDAPDGAETPTAPAPHPKKTKAELLVGTWKLVKGRPPNTQIIREYAKDGKVTDSLDDPRLGLRVFEGTYKVKDDTLFQDFNNELGLYSTTIESITEDKLVISGKNGDERYVREYERVRKK